jgi:hypothetical protein
MNFDDSPQEAAYRATVRTWIAANAPDLSGLSAEEKRNWHPKHKEVARRWQATKADAGYACISWPRERGGAGGTSIEEAIFNQEEARAGVQFTYFMTGLHMLLPALNLALLNGHIEVAKLLIESGADLQAKSPRGYATPPMVFSGYNTGGDATIARLLAAKGLDVNTANEAGETALSFALKDATDNELIRFLRGAGAKSMPSRRCGTHLPPGRSSLPRWAPWPSTPHARRSRRTSSRPAASTRCRPGRRARSRTW